jgi:precorrin-2 dehydrogenase/sirohydrochlorin ferrochelatase
MGEIALKSMRRIVCVLGAASLVCAASGAQSQQGSTAPAREASASELGRENLNRVAASAIDIKAVLVKDAGLMVELKRWIAKDATDHGQIVSDADLTDDAIFERLELDVSFRSTATALLQQYGFLLPKFNPGSEPAAEHDVMFDLRARWLAQKERQQANQPLPQNLEEASWCDPQFDPDSDCNAQQIFQAPREAPGQQQQEEPGGPPSGMAPSAPNAPTTPYGGANSLGRTQLLQPEGGPSVAPSTSQISQASASYISAPSFNNLGESASGTFPAGSGSLDAQLGDLLPEENSGSSGSDNGFPASGVAAENRRASATPARQLALFQPARMVRQPSPYGDIPSIYDMYMQAVPQPTVPERFGAEIFKNGARDPQLIPMDLPAGPDYVVDPGDGLAINLWGGVSERFYRTVDREGRVTLPEVGPILVSGKSLADVQENLQQILRTQFRDVSADVSLGRLRTIRVYVVGDVVNPGAYDISSLSTPLKSSLNIRPKRMDVPRKCGRLNPKRLLNSQPALRLFALPSLSSVVHHFLRVNLLWFFPSFLAANGENLPKMIYSLLGEKRMSLFPAFLKLAGRRCLVVGAGAVGEEKIGGLLHAGADVLVVAPRATRRVRAWAREEKLRWKARKFRPGDLQGVFLAVAATSSASLHEKIYREARRRRVLCNAVDDPPNCDFYYGAVVRRGGLQIAISTGGHSPALAQRIRKQLERKFRAEYGLWLEQLGEEREKLFAKPMDPARRRRLLHSLASQRSFEAFLRRRKPKLEKARK